MKISKIFYLMIVFMLIFTKTNKAVAQGFEGRRFLLTYQPAFSIGSILSKGNKNTQAFYEYINHHAMLEYIGNRRLSYGAEFTFLSFNSNANYQLHSYGPAIFLRYHGYKSGAIAPIGNYNKLGLQILFNQTNDFSGNDFPADTNEVLPKPINFLTTWTIGKRVPISKRILIDYGMDLSFLTLVPTYSLYSDLASRFVINFKLGLAFAAF